MVFKRNDLKSKKHFYITLIVIEIITYIFLFFTKIHGIFLFLIFPFLVLEIISNKRCLNRQKNFIKEVDFKEKFISFSHLNKSKTSINYDQLIFSFREIKFEKDKSEIELKRKRKFRNKLIGRLHIKHWDKLFEIKDELITNGVVRVKYKPEGFWSKYGGLTADIVITASAIALGEIADSDLDIETDFDSLHKDHSRKKSS